MQQHALPIDALNNFNAFASPFIRETAEHFRERNDLELKNDAARFATDIQNFIRDNPYNGNFDEYQGKMKDFTDRWYTVAGAKNTSDYYQKNIDQMRTQSLESTRNFALEQEDAWRIQQEGINFSKDVQSYVDAGMDPKIAMDMIYNRIELSKTRRQINPEEENKMRQGALQAVYGKTAGDAMSQITDVNKLQNALKEVNKRFDFMPAMQVPLYGEKGEFIGTEERAWSFDGKNEWDQTLIAQHTKRIQTKWGEEKKEAEGWFQRLLVKHEYEQAIEFAKQEEDKLNQFYYEDYPGYGNLSKEQLYDFRNYFDWRKVEGFLKEGDGGEIAYQMVVNPAPFIRAELSGTRVVTDDNGNVIATFENMKGAWAEYIPRAKDAFMLKHSDKPADWVQAMWLGEREKLFEGFKDAMRKISREDVFRNFGRAYDKLLDYDLLRTEKMYGKDNPYFYKEEDINKKNAFIEKFQNFVIDLAWSGVVDPVELERRAMAFIASDFSNVKWGQTPVEPAERNRKVKKMSDLFMSEEARDQIYSTTQLEKFGLISKPENESIIFRFEETEKLARDIRNEELTNTAKLLGLPEDMLEPGWMLSEDREMDPLLKGQFRVREGEKKGRIYQARYDYDGNSQLWELNINTGEFEDTGITIKVPMTQRELNKYIEDTGQDFMINYWSQKDPVTGEDLTDQLQTVISNLGNYENIAPPLRQGASEYEKYIIENWWSTRWELKSLFWAMNIKRERD